MTGSAAAAASATASVAGSPSISVTAASAHSAAFPEASPVSKDGGWLRHTFQTRGQRRNATGDPRNTTNDNSNKNEVMKSNEVNQRLVKWPFPILKLLFSAIDVPAPSPPSSPPADAPSPPPPAASPPPPIAQGTIPGVGSAAGVNVIVPCGVALLLDVPLVNVAALTVRGWLQ